MKKCIAVFLLLLLLPVSAQQPEWTFPLAANVVEGKGGFLVVASKESPLDRDFVPHNLTALRLPSIDGAQELRREAAEALTQMFDAAKEAGFALYVKSSYRSYQTQATMYQNRLERNGKDDGVVAAPGTSDHQTGLGVDILNLEWAKKGGMTPAFGDTAEAKWMEQNAPAYGFILRYLPEKQDQTGIIYEPWHFRYVGQEVAAYIMQERLLLEEFDAQVAAAIAAYEAQGGDYAALCRALNAPPAPKLLSEVDEEGDGEVALFYPSTP